MAIGKISGPMLQTNLERQGVDLSIDTDAVYIDVTNKRLGVNTDSPTETLDIRGNANIASIVIAGNTISSATGKLDLGSIENVQINGGSPNYLIYTDGAGNLAFGNLDLLSGVEGFTANFIELGSNTLGSFGNAVTLDESMSVTNALAIINYELGNVTANVQSLERQAYANANVASYLTIYGGNISADTVTVSSTFAGNIQTDYINPATNSTKFTGTHGIGIPVGDTISRPAGYTGQVRFNTDLTVPEFFNGTDWIALTNAITDQQIAPDGTSQNYALNQSATSAGVIVSINGTVQLPGVAYTCSGTTISFAEVPLVSDIIDIRFIATAVTTNLDYETVDTPTVTVGTSTTIIDSFVDSVFRSAKYVISGSNIDSQFYEVMLTQFDGATSVSTIANVRTGSNFVTFTANTNGSTVNLLAQSNLSTVDLRIKRTYFNI